MDLRWSIQAMVSVTSHQTNSVVEIESFQMETNHRFTIKHQERGKEGRGKRGGGGKPFPPKEQFLDI